MDPDAAARLAALVTAIDDTAAEHIAELDPAVALAVSVIVGSGRNDPAWLYDQTKRTLGVATALLGWIERAAAPDPDTLPPIVAEAIVRAAAAYSAEYALDTA